MINEYVEKILLKAVYEKLDDGYYWGEIPECPGTNAYQPTLAECKKEMREVLEDWILIALRHNHKLPIIDGIDVNQNAKKKFQPLQPSQVHIKA